MGCTVKITIDGKHKYDRSECLRCHLHDTTACVHCSHRSEAQARWATMVARAEKRAERHRPKLERMLDKLHEAEKELGFEYAHGIEWDFCIDGFHYYMDDNNNHCLNEMYTYVCDKDEEECF